MSSTTKLRKVIISHAGEDRARFVIPFAVALRSHGVDARVEEWGMLPGDSLVDRIFAEGMRQASAFVIVLSDAGASNQWAREELDTGLVARIERGTRLLPIALGRCQVPRPLRSCFERVQNAGDFDKCLARLLNMIFAHSPRPALATAAARRFAEPRCINGLMPEDAATLAAVYELSLAAGEESIGPSVLIAAMSRHAVSVASLADSMDLLARLGHVELIKHEGRGPYASRITSAGISAMLGDGEPGLIRKVSLAILSEEKMTIERISEVAGEPSGLVDFAVRKLAASGRLKASTGLGGIQMVDAVDPTLRRLLWSGP